MKRHQLLIALVVNLLVPLCGLSTDIYLPSMPSMCHYFAVPNFVIQLTVTFFTLGLGLAQAITGPVSDSLGRRQLIVVGLVLQLFSLLVILIVPVPVWVVGARLIQGIGAAIMVVPARAMLSDTFSGVILKQQFTYLTASFALGPIVAPFLGGYLQHYFGWKANFIFILVYVLIMLAMMLIVIPETLTERHSFSFKQVTTRYGLIVSNSFFCNSVILVSFMMSFIAVFNVVGPFVIQVLLGRTAIVSGYMALCSGLAWFLGNMTHRALSPFSCYSKSQRILPLLCINGVAMLLLARSHLSLLGFVFPVFIMLYLAGILFPAFVGETLSLFKQNAASANGLFFSLLWVIFSCFSFIGAMLKLHSTLPFACIYSAMTLLAYLWFRLMFQKQ